MNKKRRWYSRLIFLFLIMVFYFFSGINKVFSEELVPIRIGWQTIWATQGQIAVILKRTNILELNGLKGEFKGLSYGGPLNEAALAGEVDVIFVADQPACMLLARGANWKIIGRLIYARVGIIVPPDSKIKSIADLKGKSIGIPFGSVAQRETLKALKEAGLGPTRDVKCLNIDIYEQVNVIQKGNNLNWPGIDAFSAWDPILTELEFKNKARVLGCSLFTGVIVMSGDFIKKHPDAVVSFLKSYITAFHYYATHQKEANMWFKQEAGLDFDIVVLDRAASVEPNLKATTLEEIDISLSDKDLQIIQSGADFIYEQGLINKHISNIREYINLDFLKEAVRKSTSENTAYLSKIKAITK